MHHNRHKSKHVVYIALSAVLMAVCSWISIPTAVPFTMQTFAVFFALDFLGAKRGSTAVCIYILMGMVGIPVFSNFTAGIGVLLGPNGGYMIGWLLAGPVMGVSERFLGRKLLSRIIGMCLGLLACYTLGTCWFMTAYARTAGDIGLWTALCLCVFPFVIPDMIKLWLALWLSRRLGKLFDVSDFRR